MKTFLLYFLIVTIGSVSAQSPPFIPVYTEAGNGFPGNLSDGCRRFIELNTSKPCFSGENINSAQCNFPSGMAFWGDFIFKNDNSVENFNSHDFRFFSEIWGFTDEDILTHSIKIMPQRDSSIKHSRTEIQYCSFYNDSNNNYKNPILSQFYPSGTQELPMRPGLYRIHRSVNSAFSANQSYLIQK